MGGVALFVLDNLKCVINNSIKVNSNTESLWVATIGRKEKLVIGVLYRPPNLIGIVANFFYRKLVGRLDLGMSVSLGILITGE